ncbi:uncharacterized protein [Ptychodera flava]|uniref:uncharacterized protein n=1 Tax=Ptychodera flava TaxID=63121 RepID=UPI003969C6D8
MEVLKDASDVAPQVTSDAHQDDDTGASHSELHTSTATPEETDHQVGSHQAMQASIFHNFSLRGQYIMEDASSSPVPEQETQVSLEGLPGLLGDPIPLKRPTPDVNMNVIRVNEQIPVQEHHGQQPEHYDEARVVDRLRYGEPTSDVRYREDGPIQESGNQLQDDYNVNRAIQLVNSGQRLLGGRDFQEEGADDGGTDE